MFNNVPKEEIDNELKQHIEELYPKLKNLIEFIDIYNKNCDADTVLFNEQEQHYFETCLSILEDVKNNL